MLSCLDLDRRTVRDRNNLRNICDAVSFKSGLFGLLVLILCSASADAQEWSMRAPMPTSRQEIYADSADGLIYIPGGVLKDGVSTSNAFEAFNVNDNAWKTLAPLPAARHHITPAILGNNLYAIGGFEGPFPAWEIATDVFIYDIENDVWREGTPLPIPQGEHVALVVDDRIHVIGGRTTMAGGGANHFDAYIDTNAHHVYLEESNEWIAGSPAPTARNSAAAVSIESRIYVVGGRRNVVQEDGKQLQQNVGTLEVYDAKSDTWTTLSPMPDPFGGIAAAALGGEIYVFGGEQWTPEQTVSANTWIYNIEQDAWRKGPGLMQARHGLAAAAVNGFIYSIGGCTKTGGGAAVGDVEALAVMVSPGN